MVRTIFSLLLFISVGAQADLVRYSYSGTDSSTYTGTYAYSPGGGLPGEPGPIPVPNDLSIDLWFEVDGGLAANLSDVNVKGLVTAYGFFNYFPTNVNSHSYFDSQNLPPGYDSLNLNITVSTDGSGNIIEWDFSATADYLPGGVGFSDIQGVNYDSVFTLSPGATIGDSSGWHHTDTFYLWSHTYEYESSAVGSWSATVVPIPAAIWLFGAALASLGLRFRRRDY